MALETVVAHRAETRPVGVLRWLTTTNHHEIGILYLANSILFLLLAGILALLMRAELAYPGATIMNASTYNSLFTMHGTTMVFLVAIPVLAGFANLMVPPLIGAKDMAFPRINALSFWLIPAAGVVLWSGSAAIGWTGYTPLSVFDRSVGVDMWIVALQLLGISSTLGAINFLTTILRHRAPGVNFKNLSLFVWTVLVTQGIVLLATPVLAAGLFVLLLDRHCLTAFLTPAACSVSGGSAIMWQNLFWFYSHPAVYIMILPAMGIISEVIPRFSHKPIFGYRAIALSTIAIGFLAFGVWVHHMFTTGIDLNARLPFMILTLVIAIPSGVKVFNWIMTMWGGTIELKAPMLFSIGFVAMFVIGGINGVFQAPIPLDYALQDTYWVVAHLHYVLFGGTILAVFAGLYYWYPRMTGRMYSERLALWHFAFTMIGLNLVFFTMHFLGVAGMPRRVFDYDPRLWSLNWLATVGALVLASGQLLFLVNMALSYVRGPVSEADPWGELPATHVVYPPEAIHAPEVWATIPRSVTSAAGRPRAP